MNNLRNFIIEEDGMGTVEIVLIIVILIALVALFRNVIGDVVNDVLEKIRKNANEVSAPIPTTTTP